MAFAAIGIALLVLAVGCAAWWKYELRRSLPKVSGELRVAGLSDVVDVRRDVHGVPHVDAKTLLDAVRAQGVLHVQDRLWQMELARRVAAGRLCEVFGAVALPADRLLRRIGLRRAAVREWEHLDPTVRGLLAAYADGVNSVLTDRVPVEMRLLRITPEPWTPLDTLSCIKALALGMGANWDAELFRAHLAARLGPERAAEFALLGPLPEARVRDEILAEWRRLQEAAREYVGAAGASNCWVVSGRRTVSGKPLLASDPHLVLSLPSTWHEVHLRAPGLDVYGVGVPGVPFVVLGHSRHVAWGATNSFADVQDAYLERFHATEEGLYLAADGWRPAAVIEERIRVRNQPDVVELVHVTEHGPVVLGDPRDASKEVLALRWTAHEPGDTVAALLAMNRARSAGEFREALRGWSTPVLNFVFADDGNNIGHVMAGLIPRRRTGTGIAPVPGWMAEYEWIGRVPFEALPQSWNPASGYIVSANQAMHSPALSCHISWDFLGGARADRIEELLRDDEMRFDVDSFARMQLDVFCAPGKRLVAQCASLVPTDPLAREALVQLLAWDGHCRADSVGAAIYEALLLAATRRLLEPALGEELAAELLGHRADPISPVSTLLGRHTGLLLDTIERGSPPDLLLGSLSDAASELRTRLGRRVARWTWGRLHRLRLKHALGDHRLLGWLFNAPPVPVGGDTDTVLQTAAVPEKGYDVAGWAPSWRQVVDLAQRGRSGSILASGQSGHRASPHYLDMFPLWLRGELHPHWVDDVEIGRFTEAQMRLVPSESWIG